MLISSPGAFVVAYQEVEWDISSTLAFFSVMSKESSSSPHSRNIGKAARALGEEELMEGALAFSSRSGPAGQDDSSSVRGSF